MDVRITFDKREVYGEVTLPASKSISNRVLIINALSGSKIPIENLSDCDDTGSMLQALRSSNSRFDIGHAGTAMRFLTAYLARIPGEWEITGSDRMQQRPISALVDALRYLGANIEYTGKEGFPPLKIYGTKLRGGEVTIPASVSSQYISALMMVAPYMEQGLKIRLEGEIISHTYIEMTLRIMRRFGARADFSDHVISVSGIPYTPVAYRVEPDWSGASYFYELLAIADAGEIRMSGLQKESLQGDAGQIVLWDKLGVSTSFKADGVTIRKKPVTIHSLEYNFIGMPDLVQSFAVACCLLKIPFVFTGVATLRIKETDRLQALVDELGKLGYRLKIEGDNRLEWNGALCMSRVSDISTYHDHRMAMAFAPAALLFDGLTIADMNVVNKSFPDYWRQLEQVGGKCRVNSLK